MPAAFASSAAAVLVRVTGEDASGFAARGSTFHAAASAGETVLSTSGALLPCGTLVVCPAAAWLAFGGGRARADALLGRHGGAWLPAQPAAVLRPGACAALAPSLRALSAAGFDMASLSLLLLRLPSTVRPAQPCAWASVPLALGCPLSLCGSPFGALLPSTLRACAAASCVANALPVADDGVDEGRHHCDTTPALLLVLDGRPLPGAEGSPAAAELHLVEGRTFDEGCFCGGRGAAAAAVAAPGAAVVAVTLPPLPLLPPRARAQPGAGGAAASVAVVPPSSCGDPLWLALTTAGLRALLLDHGARVGVDGGGGGGGAGAAGAAAGAAAAAAAACAAAAAALPRPPAGAAAAPRPLPPPSPRLAAAAAGVALLALSPRTPGGGAAQPPAPPPGCGWASATPADASARWWFTAAHAVAAAAAAAAAAPASAPPRPPQWLWLRPAPGAAWRAAVVAWMPRAAAGAPAHPPPACDVALLRCGGATGGGGFGGGDGGDGAVARAAAILWAPGGGGAAAAAAAPAGAPVWACGHARHPPAAGAGPSAHAGVLAAAAVAGGGCRGDNGEGDAPTRRTHNVDVDPPPTMLVTTAAVRPGASGGALVDGSGRLVGLLTGAARLSGGLDGGSADRLGSPVPTLSFSFPSAALRPLAAALRARDLAAARAALVRLERAASQPAAERLWGLQGTGVDGDGGGAADGGPAARARSRL